MKKKYFGLRFMVSYLCVLLPLLTLSFILFGTLLHGVEKEETAKLDTQLQQTADILERDLNRYRLKGRMMMQYREFSVNIRTMDVVQRIEAITLLQRLALSDDRVDEILVCYGGDWLIGNNGVTSTDTFFNKRLNSGNAGLEKARAAIASRNLVVEVFNDVLGIPQYVMYHIPTGLDHNGTQCSVQYVFPVDNFQSFLTAELESTDLVLELVLPNGSVYFCNEENGAAHFSESQAQDLLKNHTKFSREICLAETDITVSLYYSELQQMRNLHHLRNISIILLTVGILLSSMLSLTFGFRRFHSFRRLSQSISGNSISKNKKGKWTENDYDYIQALVNESIRDSQVVRNNAKNYRRTILQQVSVMIFHGVLRDKKEIQSILSICKAELVEDYFYLCRIRLEDPEDVLRLEEYMKEDLRYCEDDSLVVLGQLSGFDHAMTMRKDIASRLYQTLQSVGISCTQIAVSQVYRHISMANYAYLEVSSILKHADPEESILCWEDLLAEHARHGIQIGNEQLQKFYAAVEQKDAARAKKVLLRIFEGDSLQDMHEDDLRYIRYMILQTLRLCNRAVLSDEENQALLQRINAVELESNHVFVEQVISLLRDCCKQSGDSFDNILKFVNENYCRYDLSLEQIAEAANVSKPQMSKMFRTITGVGYIEYVTNLRMEKAKELLACSNLSVKEIFSQVGYIDSVNASKKFKSMYGMTPSAYRTQQQLEMCTAGEKIEAPAGSRMKEDR